MPLDRLTDVLRAHVANLEAQGIAKSLDEAVVTAVLPGNGERGPRFRLHGRGEREFIRLNSNSYLGLSLHEKVIRAEEEGAQAFGAGPGAVRFISGTYEPHVKLERRLAEFHHREAGMIFSSAYAAVIGTLTSLIDEKTIVISDGLNHNCIINAMRLARPLDKIIYPHNDMDGLRAGLAAARGRARRVIIVTDGIFSMRGDHAPLDEVMTIAREHDMHYEENVIVMVDDSHGVGAFGPTGRGTEEYTKCIPPDILIGTLGKAFGVNGGYVVSTNPVIRFLRESAPLYIYSNPITPGEAQAAHAALDILDSEEGRELLERLRALTARFEQGLIEIGIEVIPGEHPVVPLMIRDTAETGKMVRYLYDHDVLVTGLGFPVVPKGDEEIRAQINADHTEGDIDHVLGLLKSYQAEKAGREAASTS